MGMALELKDIIETNLIRVSYCYISYYFHFNIPFKQLYTSNKTEHFSYKGGCGGCGHMCIKVLKRRVGLHYICVICYLKNSYSTKELKGTKE